MNKNELDSRIDRLAARVHSPKGKFADREALYAELKRRLRPSEARVVPMRRPFMQRFGRWGIAASLLLVVTLGIAGVATYRFVWSETEPLADKGIETVSPAQTPAEPLVFERMPLADIAQRLGEAYHVEITVSSADLAHYQVTATFPADEPLEEALDALCVVAQCEWQKTGERYVIYSAK